MPTTRPRRPRARPAPALTDTADAIQMAVDEARNIAGMQQIVQTYQTLTEVATHGIYDRFEEIIGPQPETIPVNLDPPPKPRLKLEHCASRTLIDLIKAAPKNEIVRVHVLNTFKKVYPIELEKFEEIKDWIETNCDNPIRDEPYSNPARPPATTRQAGDATQEFESVLAMIVSESGDERGVCSYSVAVSGEGRYEFNAADIIELAERAESLSGLLDSMLIIAKDNCPVDLETDTDSYGYNDHEDSGNGDTERVITNLTQARRELYNWLARNCPQLYERLNNAQPD